MMKNNIKYCLLAVLLILCLWSGKTNSQNAGCVDPPGIVVTPSTNQTVPINSNIIDTYRCNVDNGRQAHWEVNGIQVPVTSSRRDVFANRGINITAGSNVSEVFMTVTRDGRETFSNLDLPILCYALETTSVEITRGCLYYVRTFYTPGIPLALDFNPFRGNLSHLVLDWDQPNNTLIDSGDPVVTTYTVTVSGPTFNFTADTTDTRYEIVDSLDEVCAEHTFSVHASNQAGTGPADVIEETIPISPDIRNLSARLEVSAIYLTTPIRVDVTFYNAGACSPNFPIFSYMVNILGLSFTNFSASDPAIAGRELITLSVKDGLVPNELYSLSVSACISVTCRQSQAVTFMTTDVQSARIVFFENNIYLSCSFASSSSALGCVFIFTAPSNITEQFNVSQSDSGLCAQLQNTRNVYTSIVVLDWELDRSYGNRPIIPAENRSTTAEEFMQLTGCSLPTLPVEIVSGLSAGGIAGIVVAVIFMVVVAVVFVVVAVVIHKHRLAYAHRRGLEVKNAPPQEAPRPAGAAGGPLPPDLDLQMVNPVVDPLMFHFKLEHGRKQCKVCMNRKMLDELTNKMGDQDNVEYSIDSVSAPLLGKAAKK